MRDPLQRAAGNLLIVTGMLGFHTEGGLRIHNQPAVNAAPVRQSEPRTVWDGVFTEEQAQRGQDVYAEACTSCHRDDLSGNEDGAPPLGGDAFLSRWMGRALSEFSFVVAETMPQDDPKSLTTKQYLDIVSFILKRNGAPIGKTELPDDPKSLDRIRFTPRQRPGIGQGAAGSRRKR